MKKYLIYFSFLSLAAPPLLHAQSTEIGLFGGASFYSGDITPRELGFYFNEISPAFGVFARFNVHKTTAIRLGITQAKVTGDDANSAYPERMLNFRTNITEFALMGEFSPVQIGGRQAAVVVAPYIFGGAAIYRFNPQTLYDNNWIDLQPLGTEGQGLAGYEAPYRLTQVAIPFGVGVKFNFREAWSLGLEFAPRKIFNDNLDDITGAEVNYLDVLTGNGTVAASLSNPNIKEPQDVTYRRGGDFNDWYYVIGATLSFRLRGSDRLSGRNIGCPKF
ncbi:MAG: hypothetical protein KF852_05365 [Saprospiraceae bacterium]|nr:hypothetical protein [Saprospiraceae bacterium]